MSTNVAYNPPGAGRHYTVAELVARERAAAVRARATQRMPQQAAFGPGAEPTRRIAPVGAKARESSDRHGMHVTELLRREGVDYGDGPETAPPALAAKPQKDRSRVAMVSRAAVLFGLTVGGMVGLQTTVANTPDSSPGPVDSGGIVAAPQQIDPRSSTSEAGATETERELSGGGASPTTSADVVLRDNASQLPAQAPQGPAGGAGASAAGGGAEQTPAPAPTTTQAPAPTSADSRPDSSAQQQEQEQQKQEQQQGRSTPQQDTQQQDTQQNTPEEQPSQPEEGGSNGGGGNDDDGGLVGDVLDPVTGAVSGVLDVGGGLLG